MSKSIYAVAGDLFECVWPFCGVDAQRVKWYRQNLLWQRSRDIVLCYYVVINWFRLGQTITTIYSEPCQTPRRFAKIE